MPDDVCVNRLCVICGCGALQEYKLPNGLVAALCEVHRPTIHNAQAVLEKIREAMAR